MYSFANSMGMMLIIFFIYFEHIVLETKNNTIDVVHPL